MVSYSHQLNPAEANDIYGLIAEKKVVAIRLDNYTIGGVAVTDYYEGLHAQLHLLVRPWALKQVIKSTVLIDIISALFLNLNVVKFKVECLEQQTGAKKILKALGFRRQGILKNETIFKNELASLEIYELLKTHWETRQLAVYELRQRQEGQQSGNAGRKPEPGDFAA